MIFDNFCRETENIPMYDRSKKIILEQEGYQWN